MNVEEAVSKVRNYSSDMVLVAKPPLTWGSEALYVKFADDYGIPSETKAVGYEYVLGHEDVVTQLGYLSQKIVSARTAAEFIIHYAIHDAGPAWFDDLKGV